ncbi:transcriptional regulator [Yeosuana aromativorans]|uniref:Transcriptional regulator n=1 Tax=Yeosuana aromativorans TaxID=288019 RepID=A0A8J3FKK7_9FLAO|nr:helix-turn-helix transcriptional regulator [Yeosuana aromativorans]GGK28837.1 transcriptional regulator [Yeosuana aromativorans]
MVNTEKFAERLQKVMDFYGESASSFAEKIGVQRSSISHILSGRNKPSLEFVLKILSSFPEVELYWLLNGKGTFPAESEPNVNIDTSQDPIQNSAVNKKMVPANPQEKIIERIVIFYSDGSFENFQN